jgi:hypothetical protein
VSMRTPSITQLRLTSTVNRLTNIRRQRTLILKNSVLPATDLGAIRAGGDQTASLDAVPSVGGSPPGCGQGRLSQPSYRAAIGNALSLNAGAVALWSGVEHA